jgi:hypothetical protein
MKCPLPFGIKTQIILVLNGNIALSPIRILVRGKIKKKKHGCS